MEIKKLTAADAEQLEALIGTVEATLEDEAFWLPVKETARAHFFDEAWTEFYGAFDGERLVAAAALFYNDYEYGESLTHVTCPYTRVAEIGRAMVHPSYRGQNLLLSVTRRLVEVAKEKGVDLLVATIHPDNVPSQKSFRRLGMQPCCTYTKECGFVRDVFVMSL